MKRRRVLGLVASAALAAGSGCSRRLVQSSRMKVTVSAGPYLPMSALYLAQELGFFEQAGLDVEIWQSANSVATIPLLAGGKVDVSFLSLNPSFVNAVARGASLSIVAGREIASPGCADVGTWYGNRRAFPRGLADLRQLKGKRLAVGARASIMEFFLDAFLERAGLSFDDVQTVALRGPEASAALVGGKIDAILANDFDKRLAEASHEIVLGPRLAQLLPDFQFSYVIFGQRLLAGDAKTGIAFLTGYLRGAREFLAGRTPKFMDEYARLNGLDPKATREACRNTFTPDGSVRLSDLQRFVDWAVRKGYCPKRVGAAQLVDERFLRGVRR
jgi:NitT/TauT family transport system substrate-binding protein